MKRRERIELPALDETPIGMAWRRNIASRIERGHPSAAAVIAMVQRLPPEVKSGAMPAPAWWPGKLWLPLRTITPSVDRDSSEDEIADNFVSHLCAHRLAVPPTVEKLQRARVIASAERKLVALRRDLERLGVTQQDLFLALQNKAWRAEPLEWKTANVFRCSPAEALSLNLSDEPGSALFVLDAFIPAARAPILLRAAEARLWNPDNPPKEPATATLDAFACVLSVFVAGATLKLAAQCAIACHPEQARGIYDRAASYRHAHGDALQPRQGIEWGTGALSPLPPATAAKRSPSRKSPRRQ